MTDLERLLKLASDRRDEARDARMFAQTALRQAQYHLEHLEAAEKRGQFPQ